ncbi:uncharacterized protein K452DRAFT_217460 [Aplosporella prunicola CBS 121167]|uniref:PCI domain-containing protein n=1 Tax=Aplosporella prunicola CBS 121167 TaxID=1176127 RepID=A0A6A6BSQ7_9PEZI|nr:uncharacterized protein K452DRAFT_217460 [Aplosporella prunicola CBS 121167]KAF2147149.1 hypothetical protein K452DRAFT_217460 [Aplosporella prunicola CBS 121167]
MRATPTIDQFLSEVGRIVKSKNGAMLQDYLVLEPHGGQYPAIYTSMINEVRQVYPKGAEDALEDRCSRALPELQELDDGSSWTAFIRFIAQYLTFLRDIDVQNLDKTQLEAYNLLSELVQKCNSALSHGSMGIIILPTVIACSRMLAKLAIVLDKRPELLANVRQQAADDGSETRETLPERAANTLRQAFQTCLNDRTGTATGVRDGKPDGKKAGIYTIANLCLKILFQCHKSRSADTIFNNIQNQSPPLAVYPRPERITYLYYLGRFQFSNNHFYRALLALQAAYDQCPPQRLNQRRLILIYLVTCNIILGRFPSQQLYQQPEAAGLMEKFHPICVAIAKGNLTHFRLLTDMDTPNASWFIHYKIFYQIRSRCEIMVWRSLVRRTFTLHGDRGDPTTRRAPTVDLQDVVALAQLLETSANTALNRQSNVDPDFDGVDDVELDPLLPDSYEIESIVSSLVHQGLLGGFISHKQLRFAIQGAKKKGAMAAGFPNPWAIITARCSDEVPGWKRDISGAAVKAGGARVVNLSGARPAGSGPAGA